MASKWIKITSNKQPAAKVAEQVLTLRVQQVIKMLPLAAWKHAEDVEHVHQLRVACRRAGAAIKAFRPLMDEKPAALRNWLRRIRQAAGPARDADVLLARFLHESPVSEYVVTRLEQQRIDAQQQLLIIEKQARPKKLQRGLQKCLASLNKKSTKKSPSIGKFAKASLLQASQPVAQLTSIQKPTLEQLHELRIAGKQLRYTIELFADVLAPELRREFYPLIEELQNRLGKINDHATAQALFQHWLSQLPADAHAAEIARYVVKEYEAAEQLQAEFLTWWTPKRIAKLDTFLKQF